MSAQGNAPAQGNAQEGADQPMAGVSGAPVAQAVADVPLAPATAADEPELVHNLHLSMHNPANAANQANQDIMAIDVVPAVPGAWGPREAANPGRGNRQGGGGRGGRGYQGRGGNRGGNWGGNRGGGGHGGGAVNSDWVARANRLRGNSGSGGARGGNNGGGGRGGRAGGAAGATGGRGGGASNTGAVRGGGSGSAVGATGRGGVGRNQIRGKGGRTAGGTRGAISKRNQAGSDTRLARNCQAFIDNSSISWKGGPVADQANASHALTVDGGQVLGKTTKMNTLLRQLTNSGLVPDIPGTLTLDFGDDEGADIFQEQIQRSVGSLMLGVQQNNKTITSADINECGNCRKPGHKLAVCVEGSSMGDIIGCPACNDSSHSVESCFHFSQLSIPEQMHFVITLRGHKQPLRTTQSWTSALTMYAKLWEESHPASERMRLPMTQQCAREFQGNHPQVIAEYDYAKDTGLMEDPATKDVAAVYQAEEDGQVFHYMSEADLARHMKFHRLAQEKKELARQQEHVDREMTEMHSEEKARQNNRGDWFTFVRRPKPAKPAPPALAASPAPPALAASPAPPASPASAALTLAALTALPASPTPSLNSAPPSEDSGSIDWKDESTSRKAKKAMAKAAGSTPEAGAQDPGRMDENGGGSTAIAEFDLDDVNMEEENEVEP